MVIAVALTGAIAFFLGRMSVSTRDAPSPSAAEQVRARTTPTAAPAAVAPPAVAPAAAQPAAAAAPAEAAPAERCLKRERTFRKVCLEGLIKIK